MQQRESRASQGRAIDGFKALGDPVRLELVTLIADAGEACVCDLTSRFHLTGPTISHHLRLLREAGLVVGERRGTSIFYRIERDRLVALAGLLASAAHDRPARSDGAESQEHR